MFVGLQREIEAHQERNERLLALLEDSKWLVKMCDIVNDEEWARVTRLTARIEAMANELRHLPPRLSERRVS